MSKNPSIGIREDRKTGELIVKFINQSPKVKVIKATPMRYGKTFIIGYIFGLILIMYTISLPLFNLSPIVHILIATLGILTFFISKKIEA